MIEFFVNIFNITLYQPLFNILILLYQYLPGHDLGAAVIILTVLIRVILYPLGIQAIRSQKALSELQPKIQEIQKKYKHDKEKQARATMELYQKEKINPFSGCLPLFIQFPILIALFLVFKSGFQPEQMIHLYSFVPSPGIINPSFLGIANLAQSCSVEINGQQSLILGNVILAVFAGVSQFFQTKMIAPKTKQTKDKTGGFSQIIQKQMLYFFPVFTVFICWNLPSAVALYWGITSIFTIIQQHFVQTKH